MDAQIIKVTTKGQIAIPVSIRKELSIETGDSLVAYTYGDALMLKVIKLPNEEEFKKTMDEAQAYAKKIGLSEDDVNSFVKEARKSK